MCRRRRRKRDWFTSCNGEQWELVKFPWIINSLRWWILSLSLLFQQKNASKLCNRRCISFRESIFHHPFSTRASENAANAENTFTKTTETLLIFCLIKFSSVLSMCVCVFLFFLLFCARKFLLLLSMKSSEEAFRLICVELAFAVIVSTWWLPYSFAKSYWFH